MTLRFKHKRRLPRPTDCSESDSDTPLYKRERLQHVKKIKNNLQTVCDNDSASGARSDNIMLVKQIARTSHANITDRENGKNKQLRSEYRTKFIESDSDSTTTDAFKINVRKKTMNKEHNVDCDADNSGNSSTSLFESKKKFLGQSSITRHDKKSNNKGSNKSNSTKDAHHGQIIESGSSEENCNGSNIVPSISTKDNQEAQGKKQNDPVNCKLFIIKVIDEIQHRFTRFKTQITNLQEKYFKDNLVSLQDAKDIIFILTCIISRLKEEFTEHQQDLMDSYMQWNMKPNSKPTVPSMQSAQIPNNNDLQVQSKTPTSCDTDDEIFTPFPHRKRPLQERKSVSNNVQLSDKDSVPHKNNKTYNNTYTLEDNEYSVISDQTNKSNVTLESNQSAVSISKDVTRIIDVTSSMRGAVENPKRRINLPLMKKLTEQKLEAKQNFFHKLLNMDADEILNYDSDVDSTCSTLHLQFSENLNRQRNNRINATINKDKSKSDFLEGTKLNTTSNDAQRCSLYRINSNDTICLNSKTTDTKKRSYITDKKMSLSNKNLRYKPESEFIVPTVNNLSKNHHLQYDTDKKLQMKCRVLVKKCKL